MEKETTAKKLFTLSKRGVNSLYGSSGYNENLLISRALRILQFHKIILKKSRRCKEINFMLPNLFKVEHVILLGSFLAFFSLCCIKQRTSSLIYPKHGNFTSIAPRTQVGTRHNRACLSGPKGVFLRERSAIFDLKVKPKQLCLYLCRDDQEEQKHPRHNLSKKEVTTRVDAPL